MADLYKKLTVGSPFGSLCCMNIRSTFILMNSIVLVVTAVHAGVMIAWYNENGMSYLGFVREIVVGPSQAICWTLGVLVVFSALVLVCQKGPLIGPWGKIWAALMVFLIISWLGYGAYFSVEISKMRDQFVEFISGHQQTGNPKAGMAKLVAVSVGIEMVCRSMKFTPYTELCTMAFNSSIPIMAFIFLPFVLLSCVLIIGLAYVGTREQQGDGTEMCVPHLLPQFYMLTENDKERVKMGDLQMSNAFWSNTEQENPYYYTYYGAA